jgi:hypothetical protein
LFSFSSILTILQIIQKSFFYKEKNTTKARPLSYFISVTFFYGEYWCGKARYSEKEDPPNTTSRSIVCLFK